MELCKKVPLTIDRFLYISILLFVCHSSRLTCIQTIGPQDQQASSSQPDESARTKSTTNSSHVKEIPVSPMSPAMAAAAAAAGYLFGDATDERLNQTDHIDALLSNILDRDGPDMRASRDFRDSSDITVAVAQRAWRLMHKHAQIAVANRIDTARPLIEQVLIKADVSFECRDSIRRTLDGAKQMKGWAIKMLNSWGNFPSVGLFEGTYSDIGSYHVCVDVKPGKPISHAHYCTITYRPVLPWRRDYELVINREPDEFLNSFSNGHHLNSSNLDLYDQQSSYQHPDAFEDLLKHAHYNHFVYYKWGTCWPIECTPFDVRRVSKMLGRRNILMSGPVKCFSTDAHDYEKPGSIEGSRGLLTNSSHKLIMSSWDLNGGISIWKPYFNHGQQMALTVLVVLTGLIVSLTIIDLLANRVPRLSKFLRWSLKARKLSSTSLSATTDEHHSDFRPVSAFETSEVTLGLQLEHEKLSVTAANMAATAAQIDLIGSRENGLSGRDQLGSLRMDNHHSQSAETSRRRARPLTFMNLVDCCSILSSIQSYFRVSESQMKNEIMCINGIRWVTMSWIIMTHTMLYNDWSAFARTREIEKSLKSIASQPLFNASHLVDTFFLMSGLLTSYTAFRHCQGKASKFNSFAYIFGRWLRLTPQVFLVSMIYIVIPAISHGPHWQTMVAEHSENCVDNWWINLVHLQAFYRTERMCNFVTWWISIDFLYHFGALALTLILLRSSHRLGLVSLAGLVVPQVAWQAIRHYQLALPPNVFSTIPLTGAAWTDMTLSFYWKPFTHAVPYFLGFYSGYLIALKRGLILDLLNTRRAALGWFLTVILLIAQGFSTFWWVTGSAQYSRLTSTIYNVICPILWAVSMCWIIIACHHGYGGFVNRLLSLKAFVLLGKSSYMVYLTHFHILLVFVGNQSVLADPNPIYLSYTIVGNIFAATFWGTLLCIVYEIPCLRVQRLLMQH